MVVCIGDVYELFHSFQVLLAGWIYDFLCPSVVLFVCPAPPFPHFSSIFTFCNFILYFLYLYICSPFFTVFHGFQLFSSKAFSIIFYHFLDFITVFTVFLLFSPSFTVSHFCLKKFKFFHLFLPFFTNFPKKSPFSHPFHRFQYLVFNLWYYPHTLSDSMSPVCKKSMRCWRFWSLLCGVISHWPCKNK